MFFSASQYQSTFWPQNAIQAKKAPFNAKSLFWRFGIMYFFMYNRHIDKNLTNCEIVIFLTIFRQIVKYLTRL